MRCARAAAMSASYAALAGDVAGSIICGTALPADFGARLGALMPGAAALRCAGDDERKGGGSADFGVCVLWPACRRGVTGGRAGGRARPLHARARTPRPAGAPFCSQTHVPRLFNSLALATKDGSSLLLFPVALTPPPSAGLCAAAAGPGAPIPPRPAARAGAGTASWMAFQAVEPLRSEEHGER